MPNVNLIAARREEKKRLETMTRRLFLGLIGSVMCLLILVSVLGARRIGLNNDLAAADIRMKRLQPTLDNIAQIEKDTSELAPKVEMLQTAKSGTLRWRALFQIVSQSVPQAAWLSGMTSIGASDDMTITLTGMAGSQTLVGETMSRLNAYPLFDKVDLRFTQTSGSADDPIQRISFEIGAHLKSTTPKKDENKATPAADGKKTAQQAGGKGSGSSNG